MVSAKLNACGVCSLKESGKYRCPIDDVEYCSLICFKSHKATNCTSTNFTPIPKASAVPMKRKLELNEPIYKLSSLEWPMIPEDTGLLSTELKSLQLQQFESIASSTKLRNLLSNPNLIDLLTRIHQSGRQDLIRSLMGKVIKSEGVYRPSAANSGKFRAEGNSAVTSSTRGTRAGRGRAGRAGNSSRVAEGFGEEERKLMMEFINVVEEIIE